MAASVARRFMCLPSDDHSPGSSPEESHYIDSHRPSTSSSSSSTTYDWSSPGSFNVPLEVACKIFGYLGGRDLVSVGGVCRSFHAVVTSTPIFQWRLQVSSAHQLMIIPTSPKFSRQEKLDLITEKWRSETTAQLNAISDSLTTMQSIMPAKWNDRNLMSSTLRESLHTASTLRDSLHTIYAQALVRKVAEYEDESGTTYFDPLQMSISFYNLNVSFSSDFLSLLCKGINEDSSIIGLTINEPRLNNESIIAIANSLELGKMQRLFLYGEYQEAGLKTLIEAFLNTPQLTRGMSVSLQSYDCSAHAKRAFKSLAELRQINGSLSTKKSVCRI